MSNEKTKRVCELKCGDFFVWNNTTFIVHAIKDGKIYYKSVGYHSKLFTTYFGAKNQMKVKIYNPHKQPSTINEYRKSITVYDNVRSLYNNFV